jgi:uncharacterized lipoprotein YbaY
VTGTLTYMENASLTPNARALIVLVEGAGKPTAGSIVASDVIAAPGQVPIAYSLSYTNASIDQGVTYTIQAAIVDGERVWGTGGGTPVITKGNPTSDVDLTLIYRTDLLKGSVTGSISGVDIELGPEAYSAAVLLDRSTDTTAGIDVQVPSTVPIPFTIPFDPAKIDQSTTYVVGASIVSGEDRWENRTGVPVITNGNPLTDITVPVAALVPPAPVDNGLGPLGWIVLVIGLIALVAAAFLYMRSRRPPSPAPVGAAVAAGTATETEDAATEGSSTPAAEGNEATGDETPTAAEDIAVGDEATAASDDVDDAAPPGGEAGTPSEAAGPASTDEATETTAASEAADATEASTPEPEPSSEPETPADTDTGRPPEP